MPYTMDSVRPKAERYSSLKFRRVARMFHAHRLDYADAYELCAIVNTLGITASARLFEWNNAARREFRDLEKVMDVAQAVQANRDAYTRAEGLVVLRELKELGWRNGQLPEIVRVALMDLRKAGCPMVRIAQDVGLSVDQVYAACNGPRRRVLPVSLADAALVAR